jgi:rhodanese-related sulfurtransferase
MRFDKRGACLCLFILLFLTLAGFGTTGVGTAAVAQANSAQVQFVSVDELKAKLAKNEPVTIIDVRGSNGLQDNDNKIKGALYVKLRRLKAKLGVPPLRDVSRDREVVTYCACPNDEAGIRAAQMLLESGFKRVRVLKGGWVTWKRANGQVEPMSRGM